MSSVVIRSGERERDAGLTWRLWECRLARKQDRQIPIPKNLPFSSRTVEPAPNLADGQWGGRDALFPCGFHLARRGNETNGGGTAAFECTRKPSGRPLSPGPFYLLCGVTFVKTQRGLSARGGSGGGCAGI